MVDKERVDRRLRRHEATKSEIVGEAWKLARSEGLGSFSMRQLAASVDMKAPSLYQYFSSKDDLYDAMYAGSFAALIERLRGHVGADAASREDLRRVGRVFVEFCTEDSLRYQLMFERPIPSFEPTPESFAISQEALESHAKAMLAGVGVTDPGHIDLFLALSAGLISLQIANDPGGDRWTRLLDDAIDMFSDYVGVA